MALVNIPRDRDDPNYRYKMPKLISKIEGRGNGIKTNISNMGEISRALKRPPMYPTKFFGCELGAMAKFEEAEEKALVNGAHKESDLVIILDKFIQMYVLCPSCELPEIDINVKKGLLTCKCNACGYIGSLDNVHKAATYMVRNPPDSASSTMGKKKKSKEERRAEKQQQQRDKRDRISRKGKSLEGEENEEKEGEEGEEKQQDNGDEEGGSSCSSGTSCSNARSSADDAVIVNGAETHSKKSRAERSADATPTNEGETDSWDEQPQEKSREARRRERRERRAAAAAEGEKRQLMHKEALVFESPELQDVIERLRNVVVKNEKVDISSFFQELRMLQVSQDFDAKCRLYVTLGALFKDGITPASLEKRMAYVTKVVDSSVSAADVLDALGYFAYEQGPASLANFPYFLQKLYNAEVLEADDILKYYKEEKADPLYTACRKHAGPFLQWLREDEEEDEEEEKSCLSGDSDEDEEEEDDEEAAERENKDKKREESEEAGEGKDRSEKAERKKDKDEAKKGEGEEKKKGGVKGRAEKKDEKEDEEDEEDEEEEDKVKEGKGKGWKEKAEKKSRHNSNGNNNVKKGADTTQVEETGSGGEKGKGRKEDNQQKNGGGGKGKRKEKK